MLWVGLSTAGEAQDKDWSALPYQDGEILKYDVYYNWGLIWVPAGEVIFQVIEHDNHIEFDVTGRSYSSYDSMFKVRDYYTSEVDKTTMYPMNFRRDVLEGNYERFDSIRFDQEGGTLVEYFGKTRQSAKMFKFDIKDKVHDMVSAIYNIREQRYENFNNGDQIPIDIFFDKELFEIEVQYNGIKRKKIKRLGKVNAYHLQPELIDGYVFSKGDIMDIWVSTDGNHIPLMIESPISIGSVKAILSGVTHTKYSNNKLPDSP